MRLGRKADTSCKAVANVNNKAAEVFIVTQFFTDEKNEHASTD